MHSVYEHKKVNNLLQQDLHPKSKGKIKNIQVLNDEVQLAEGFIYVYGTVFLHQTQ